MSTLAARRPSSTIGRTLVVGLFAGLAAGVANVLVYFLAASLFSLPFLVPMGGPGSAATPLPLVAILLATLIPALLAAALFWVLGRFIRRATTLFVGAALLFGLLSLAGPLTLPIDLGTRLALAFMHVVAGVIITYGLVRNAPQS